MNGPAIIASHTDHDSFNLNLFIYFYWIFALCCVRLKIKWKKMYVLAVIHRERDTHSAAYPL